MHDYYRIGGIGGPERPRDRRATRQPDRAGCCLPGPPDLGYGFGEDHCFSDEIVVDFPSMQEAVARIRASFLAS